MPRRRLVQAYARYQSYERQTYCRLIYDDGHDCSDFFEAERLQELLPRLFEQHAPAHFGGLGSVHITYDGTKCQILAYTTRGPIDVTQPPSILAEMAKALLEHAAMRYAVEAARVYYSERQGYQRRVSGLASDPVVANALMGIVEAVSGDDMFELCSPSDHIVLFATEPLTARVRNVGSWALIEERQQFPSDAVYDVLLAATVHLS